MNRTIDRIQSALADPRMTRAVVLFVRAGVLLSGCDLLVWLERHGRGACCNRPRYAARWCGVFLVFLSVALRPMECALWHYGNRMPRARHLAIDLSGLALTATPGKSGETFRYALPLQQGVRVPNSLAAFVADRAGDVLGVCLPGFLAVRMSGPQLAWTWITAFAVLLLGSCSAALPAVASANCLSLEPVHAPPASSSIVESSCPKVGPAYGPCPELPGSRPWPVRRMAARPWSSRGFVSRPGQDYRRLTAS